MYILSVVRNERFKQIYLINNIKMTLSTSHASKNNFELQNIEELEN